MVPYGSLWHKIAGAWNSPRHRVKNSSTLSILCITFERGKILDVDVGMWGRNISHVYTIEQYWDHVVGKDLEILLCYIIFAEGIL